MAYYAVLNGRKIGIFRNWIECYDSIKYFSGAKYKKFDLFEEAQQFINNNVVHNIMTANINDNDNFIPDYYVYTDGACVNNGKKNAIAGSGVFFGINDVRNISKRIDGKQTNNTAEITALLLAYEVIENDIMLGKKIVIASDSIYAIRCATSYGEQCAKTKWKNNIPNKDLVQKLYKCYKDKKNIQFIHIKAHTENTDTHSIGNHYADKLANEAIGLTSCPYNDIITKIYLNVPYSRKEEVKSLGGCWDKDVKKWFIFDNNNNKEKIISIF